MSQRLNVFALSTLNRHPTCFIKLIKLINANYIDLLQNNFKPSF